MKERHLRLVVNNDKPKPKKEIGPTNAINLIEGTLEQRIARLKYRVAAESGRILSSEEADFIASRVLDICNKREEGISELNDKFPELADFFHKLDEELEECR